MGTDDAFSPDAIKPIDPGIGSRVRVTFSLPKSPNAEAAVSRIAISVDDDSAGADIPPEAGTLVEIESLKFSLDRQGLRFPTPPAGSLREVEIPILDALRSELIDNLHLVPASEVR